MQLCIALLAFTCAITLAASCLVAEPSTNAGQLSSPKIYKNHELCSSSGGTANCTSRLAATQSTSNNTCPLTGEVHYWPIDGPSSNCHGWEATDPTGRVHQNSADNIRCACDGTALLYTQYAAALDCTGTGHDKSYILNECHQGMPPMLWDRAVDLSCCEPSSDCAVSASETTPVSEPSEANNDWLENDARLDPPVADADKEFYVTIGMSNQADCAQIGERAVLRLYVGPNTSETCQGWNHYPNPYPDTSSPHANSAINVRCVDGGVAYTQTPGHLDCGGSFSMAKHDYYRSCHQGTPPTVYTELLDFSGCLKQGFSPNATVPPAPAPAPCSNKCDTTGDCAEPTCAALVQKYSCTDYFRHGKIYAGWCDKECGVCN